MLNSDLDIKQAAAAVTLRLTRALQGVARVSNSGQAAAVNYSESLSFCCVTRQLGGVKGVV